MSRKQVAGDCATYFFSTYELVFPKTFGEEVATEPSVQLFLLPPICIKDNSKKKLK